MNATTTKRPSLTEIALENQTSETPVRQNVYPTSDVDTPQEHYTGQDITPQEHYAGQVLKMAQIYIHDNGNVTVDNYTHNL